MALRQYTPFRPHAVRHVPVIRRSSLTTSGFAFGVMVMAMVALFGMASIWLNFRTHDLRLQHAHLQSHALGLEQDRLRMVHAVERLADPSRLRTIARTDLGLVDLGIPDAQSTVLVEDQIESADRSQFVRKTDPVFGDSQPSPIVTAAVNLLGATEAVAAPVQRSPRSAQR